MYLQKSMQKIIILLLVVGIFSCQKDSTTESTTTIPILTTTGSSAIGQTSAASGGSITSDGGSLITARGVCWSTGVTPTISDYKTTDGSGKGTYVSNITGLAANTKYYARAYATNNAGTGYGNVISFTTLQVNDGTVTDIDGNVYHSVTIGTQVWLRENLKVTHYRNGDPIPLVVTNPVWSSLTTSAYSNYNNDPTISATYGVLYNWYAASDSRNIAPEGWHVPTNAEWTILINYLGGEDLAGAKMKETGTLHWQDPNTGANNQSGFTALGAGERDGTTNLFSYFQYASRYWSSDQFTAADGWFRAVFHYATYCYNGDLPKQFGLSIRLIKD
ncbi:MAG: fibrobacter succinogenes major paralogous domain-containing protein [bacterium]